MISAKHVRRMALSFAVASSLIGGMALAWSPGQTPRPEPASKTATVAPATGPVAPAAQPAGAEKVELAPAAGPADLAPAVSASPTIELCAKTGQLPLPGGAEVTIWGLAVKPAGVPCSDPSVTPGLPGPTLELTAGDSAQITLHNELPGRVSLVFPGQDTAPDHAGVPSGGTASYDIANAQPGTFLYESGVDSARQVALGLHGALVVRPAAPGVAYPGPAGAASAHDREAILVLSEIDPALHDDPAGFDMGDYRPRYWLINGKAHPATDPIAATTGERVLLRYANAGANEHTMSLVGARQQTVGLDGFPASYPHGEVSVTLGQGATREAIVEAPSAPARLGLYSRAQRLTNGASFPGGMLTFLEVDVP